jgi:hypothetical protein
MASFDIEIDDIMYGLSRYEKQELIDELYEAGYIPKKLDKELDYDGSDWNDSVKKLLDNRWKLSKEDEETILRITNKLA